MAQVQQQQQPMQHQASLNMGPCGSVAHLHSVEKALSLPVVEAAVSQASNLYSAVKGAHPLVNWALMTAERTAMKAAVTATPIMAPFAAPLAAPIAKADAKLAAGLQILEDKVPMVKQRPEEVYACAKEKVHRALQPRMAKVNEVRESATRAAVSLRDLSWRAANDVLATQTGKMAVEGVDGGAAMAQKLLDYYLPAQNANNAQQREIVSACTDPALHTVQTMSRLSMSVAERLMAAIAQYVRELRTTHDPARYVAALLSVLHLTRLLQQIRPHLVQSANQETTNQNMPIGKNACFNQNTKNRQRKPTPQSAAQNLQ